ncbi:hypothetical protein ACRALDRAFT_1083472 [Sodiomyces alcalophilus JCM 7366]|uniref:uncharacterized protein n=1 Tax=Sodiomyces alcalophilus JCM 7366 TaxID=591952 RepID=UPI0039B3E8D5
MTYNVMVFAARKLGITHEQFKTRYEQHMRMVEEICGDAMPLSHTRWYTRHEGVDDKPVLLAGNVDERHYDVVVLMVFEDEAAFAKFYGALLTEEANARIEADEAGFWDRDRMQVVVIGDVKETRK